MTSSERCSRSPAERTFEARRDHAMIRLFLDSGIRVGEMERLALPDVDSTCTTWCM
jgi:site-specific recombinase XerD